MALAIFVPNLAGIHQPVLKLYQTVIHPALSPVLGQFLWLVRMARNSRGSGFNTWQTGQAGGEGGCYEYGLAWLRPLSPQRNSSRSYYFALFSEVT